MPHTIKNGPKKDVSINLRSSDNGGYIVECSWHEEVKKDKSDDCCGPSSYKHKPYVYETLDAALSAIPGLISVKQDMDPDDATDRKIMEEEDY